MELNASSPILQIYRKTLTNPHPSFMLTSELSSAGLYKVFQDLNTVFGCSVVW